LRSLPRSLWNLKELENVQLRYNWLDSLPSNIGNCSSLRFIYLNRNNLVALPESIGELKNLRELYLSSAGPLLQLPESICKLRRLELIEVDQFIVLPTCLITMQSPRMRIIMN
jgi:Leucine-rich repeat (LRR) protein